MNVRWKSGSQVKKAREVTSMRETEEMIGERDECYAWSENEM